MRNFYKISTVLFLFISCAAHAQNIGINTAGTPGDPSSMLDVSATDKGILIPRVSLGNVSNSASPVNSPSAGLLVYNTNAAVVGGSGIGFYYWTGSAWVKIINDQGEEFIRNQNSADQSANFRITGTGRANTSIQSPVYTRADAGTVGVRPNTNSVTAIQLQDASGAPILNVDATNARIGIGTNNPVLGKLQINAGDMAIRISENAGAQNSAGHTNLGSISFYGHNRALGNNSARIRVGSTGWDDAGYFAFETSNDGTDAIERVRISETGTVGIGSTVPSNLLQVAANENQGIDIGLPNDNMGNNGGSVAIRFFGYRDVRNNFIGAKITSERTNACCGWLSQGNDIVFYTLQAQPEIAPANPAAPSDYTVERMRITSAGSVNGNFKHIMYQNFNNPTFRNTNGIVWFPVGYEGDDIDITSVTAGPSHNPRVEFIAPYSGRIVKVSFKVDGISSGAQEARGRIVTSINGTVYNYTAAGTMMDLNEAQSATIVFPVGTTGYSFNAGDRVSIGFHYGETGNGGCPSGDCYLEDNDYGVVTVIEYNIQD